jgi:hypothetical protein
VPTLVERSRRLRLPLLETAGVLASPVVAFFLLRMQPMASPNLPDPGESQIFVVDPRDVFYRYAQVYGSTARLREGARVGFLVPARISYLLFGTLGGFYVYRYLLAVLAAGAAYLLLRRCYGPLAGLAGLIAVLASPVLVVAWGTDYADAAAVSYLVAGLACLAMPSAPHRRRVWMAAGGFFLVMTTWAHGMGALLAGVTVLCYLAVRLLRDRDGLLADVGILAGVALLTTGLLSVGSGLVIGQFNFLTPTYDSFRYLSQPSQEVMWHSTSARWAPYVAYLLVLPATVVAFAVTFAVRRSATPTDDGPGAAAVEATPRIGTPQLVVGLACAAQVVVSIFMQFAGSLQTLEVHYFSSTLWAAALLAFAVVLVELADRAPGRGIRLVPAACLLAIPLGYVVVRPSVPTFGWWPKGWLVAIFVVASVVLAAAGGRLRRAVDAGVAVGAGILGATAGAFVLTIVQIPNHPVLPGTIYDPPPLYASALGGNGTVFVQEYQVAAELPAWVGNATYRGEQLMMWTPLLQTGIEIDSVGEYHAGFNLLDSTPPALTGVDRAELADRRPAELLLLGPTGEWMPAAVAALAAYQPTVLRSTVLRSGTYALHVELLQLHAYPRLP